ncbi:hypothetical protein PybrP1_010140 [[Pythium] brassicae (nom. inval.)]|nr:hypothetical protein PybrP1_010140 [[Pythium] brassicae (nom. inval.)]
MALRSSTSTASARRRSLYHSDSSSSSSSASSAATAAAAAIRASTVGLEANALCHPSHWVPKSARSTCTRCERPFRLWTTKHHCRLCGEVVCRHCSTQRILIQKKTLRSCDACVSVSVQRIADFSQRNSQVNLGPEASALAAATAMSLAGRRSDGALLRKSLSSQRRNSVDGGKRLRRSMLRRESSISAQSTTSSALHTLRRRYRSQLPYVVVVFLLTLAGISNLLASRA